MTAVMIQPKTLHLRARTGPRPQVFMGPPQSQLDQFAPADIREALIVRVANLPGVVVAASRRAMWGTMGLHLRDADAKGPEQAFLIDQEFAHVHPGADSSMHLTLPTPLRLRAIEAGWAQPHPLAGAPTVSPDTVMVYAPRDEDELHLVTALTMVAWARASGACSPEDFFKF